AAAAQVIVAAPGAVEHLVSVTEQGVVAAAARQPVASGGLVAGNTDLRVPEEPIVAAPTVETIVAGVRDDDVAVAGEHVVAAAAVQAVVAGPGVAGEREGVAIQPVVSSAAEQLIVAGARLVLE